MKQTIGDKLRELRGTRTRREVANALGVTTDAIAKYENDRRVPTDAMKVKIARYYDVDIAVIFFA